MAVFVGWAALDVLARPHHVAVGWAELDLQARSFHVAVGWAELDMRATSAAPVPPFAPGDGVARYHSRSSQQYFIPLDVDSDDEEEIITAILMEIAAHAIY